jgi:EmrB/QacA subfamily drug resistance transporter
MNEVRVPELGYRRRLLVLGICCTSVLVVSMDTTIVNLALPAIQRQFAAATSSLQWTIDAYAVVLASLLMLAGSTADRIGRRRVFQTGLVLFTLGSLLCSLAPSVGLLVVFRMVQAVGGSMLNPVAMSIVTNTFVDPKERARAIGVWAGVFGVSMALGPLVGGALVDAIGWRSIFWINVPIGVPAVVLAALFVPESKAPKPRRIDPVGQVLMIALLGGVTYGIIEAPHAPRAVTVGCFVLAALAAFGLVTYERRREEPLIDPRFFRSVPFSGATLTAICGFAALAGFLFLNSIYLQDVRGLSPLHAGLLTLPTAVGTFTFSLLSGRLLATRGARVPLVFAGIAIVLAGLLLTRLTADSPVYLLVLAYLVFGIGFGLVNPPITNSAVSGMPLHQAGVAAAVASTSRQVGAALGVAVLGTVTTTHIHGPLVSGFTPASHGAWWIMVGCGVIVLTLGFATTTEWARRTRFEESVKVPVA